jgi:hypothetical protein
VRRLARIHKDLLSVEHRLMGTGPHARGREPLALPQVLARLGTAVRSHVRSLALVPELNWAAVTADLEAAERYITQLGEELVLLLDSAVDVAARLAGDEAST